jgi:hypothetical protein
MTGTRKEAVIGCDGVWKIVGEKVGLAAEAVRREGLSKTAIR